MLKKILVGALAFLVFFAILVAMQPDDFRVARSALINAGPEVIFPKVNNLSAWDSWSPWAKIDPNMKTSLQGPAEGTDASSHWSGNNEVGEGTMTITESRPNEFIKFRLDFIKPFEGTNEAEFSFQPEGAGTRVTWSMYGKNNFFAKAIGLFINCDKMIGEQFEKGLASLDALVTASK